MIKIYVIFLASTWIPLLACLIIKGKEYFGSGNFIVFNIFITASVVTLIAVLFGKSNEPVKEEKE